MKPFQFLNNDEYGDELTFTRYEGASWMYGWIENLDQYQHEIVIEHHYGIHSFLNHFPVGFIVVILTITGPNGRIHNIDSEYSDGWGFDILSDLLIIEWVRFRNR